MSTKYSQLKQHTLVPPSDPKLMPLGISKRKLPPLPISKRLLPSLPGNKKTSIIITPPISETATQHESQSSIGSRSNIAIRNFFNKLHTKLTKNNNVERMSEIIKINNIKIKKVKSKWRPNLIFIYDDDELLQALTIFMTKQFNEENILFLQSVRKLNKSINDLLMFNSDSQINIVEKEKIDVEIASIYNKYITHTAQKQVNLSFNCFTNIMHIHQTFTQLSLNEKAQIFNISVIEIQKLVHTAILSGFYNSDEFQSIARVRNILSNEINCNVQQKQYKKNDDEESAIVLSLSVFEDVEYDSDDIAYDNESKYESNDVEFDICSTNKWRGEHNKYILSSAGFAINSGYHEWKIKILKCSQYRQEFGIISNFDVNICMNEYGICDTQEFGARCVYGYNKLIKLNKNKKQKRTQHNFYYASFNADNTVRCSKDLSSLNVHQRQWIQGDIIKICLNLAKSSIKFFLNDKQVRKTVSIENDTMYYPIILYSGDCQFKVMS